jgi:hypothetical protein
MPLRRRLAAGRLDNEGVNLTAPYGAAGYTQGVMKLWYQGVNARYPNERTCAAGASRPARALTGHPRLE